MEGYFPSRPLRPSRRSFSVPSRIGVLCVKAFQFLRELCVLGGKALAPVTRISSPLFVTRNRHSPLAPSPHRRVARLVEPEPVLRIPRPPVTAELRSVPHVLRAPAKALAQRGLLPGPLVQRTGQVAAAFLDRFGERPGVLRGLAFKRSLLNSSAVDGSPRQADDSSRRTPSLKLPTRGSVVGCAVAGATTSVMSDMVGRPPAPVTSRRTGIAPT